MKKKKTLLPTFPPVDDAGLTCPRSPPGKSQDAEHIPNCSTTHCSLEEPPSTLSIRAPAYQSNTANPANSPAATTPRPYVLPNRSVPAAFLLPNCVPSARPSNVSVGDEVEVDVADAVVEAVVLARGGFWAPHGWSSRHEDAHWLSISHAATHWSPHRMHTWYGSVSVYSDMLGCLPSLQTQPYVRDSCCLVSEECPSEGQPCNWRRARRTGSQSLTCGGPVLVWRQMLGQLLR